MLLIFTSVTIAFLYRLVKFLINGSYPKDDLYSLYYFGIACVSLLSISFLLEYTFLKKTEIKSIAFILIIGLLGLVSREEEFIFISVVINGFSDLILIYFYKKYTDRGGGLF